MATVTGSDRQYRWLQKAISGGSHDYEYSRTEAIIGIIELGRRIARGFRNLEQCRIRMFLITGGLDASPHTVL